MDDLESHNGAETIPIMRAESTLALLVDRGHPKSQAQKYIPFWIRIFKLSLTESAVSKTMSRKLSGRTS